MNEQHKAWLEVEYSNPPSLTPEERNHRFIFESIMRQVDVGQLTLEQAIDQIRQRDQVAVCLSRFAVIGSTGVRDSYYLTE
jgi:hypothetical protein